MRLNTILLILATAIGCSTALSAADRDTCCDVPVFITIGQSNADGSAFRDTVIDNDMKAWYCSAANPRKMKIWYRSCKIQNQPPDSRGIPQRWVVDGDTTDASPGWMDLWYRNENADGRTAMNMIHGYGTYSTGTGTDCAQGRRGMEGEFGRIFQTAYPDSELYILKLGASGSSIATWADDDDSHNWNYFYRNIYLPAIKSLLSQGKRPRLAGIWWMQGCADQNESQQYYEARLEKLLQRLRSDLGFDRIKLYIGLVVKPGENPDYPDASVQYGDGVRAAQQHLAARNNDIEIVSTSHITFQNEPYLGGHLHYDHAGVNAIGRELAKRVIAAGPGSWGTLSVLPAGL